MIQAGYEKLEIFIRTGSSFYCGLGHAAKIKNEFATATGVYYT
jgi:hypothetical protein